MLLEVMTKIYELLGKGTIPSRLYISYKDFQILQKEYDSPIVNFLDLTIIITNSHVDVQ